MEDLDRLPYREVWVVDTEYHQDADLRPVPVCFVGRELRTGRELRLWRDQLPAAPPFSVKEDVLFVFYAAWAECGFSLRCGWPMPRHVLDLAAEFRNLTNGLPPSHPGLELGRTLLGACRWFGVTTMGEAGKDAMRETILSGGPWSTDERRKILNYCAADVDATAALFCAMLPHLLAAPKRFKQALHRGRYTGAAVARMQDVGVPLDVPLLRRMSEHWEDLKRGLVRESGVAALFDDVHLKYDRLELFAAARGIPWPRTTTGRLATDEDTLRDLGKAYPAAKPVADLLYALGKLKLNALLDRTGADGRNRVLLSPLGARTGRNTPSNAGSVFGPAVWAVG